MHPERSTTVTSAGVLFTNHEVQSRHCRHVCWLPVLQGFCQLSKSHPFLWWMWVGEEQWSRFPLNLKAGAQLRRRSLPSYHWPNTPACFCRAFLWPLSPSLIPGNHLTGVDLRSSWQSLLRSRSRFTICSLPALVTKPTNINSMKLIWLILFYHFCSHRCSNPILNRQLVLRQCWSLRSEGSFHTSHACPDNILEDKLLLYPPPLPIVFFYRYCAYNLWHISCLFPWGWGLSRLFCLAETIFGDKNIIIGETYSHNEPIVGFCESKNMASRGPWMGFWRLSSFFRTISTSLVDLLDSI